PHLILRKHPWKVGTNTTTIKVKIGQDSGGKFVPGSQGLTDPLDSSWPELPDYGFVVCSHPPYLDFASTVFVMVSSFRFSISFFQNRYREEKSSRPRCPTPARIR